MCGGAGDRWLAHMRSGKWLRVPASTLDPPLASPVDAPRPGVAAKPAHGGISKLFSDMLFISKKSLLGVYSGLVYVCMFVFVFVCVCVCVCNCVGITFLYNQISLHAVRTRRSAYRSSDLFLLFTMIHEQYAVQCVIIKTFILSFTFAPGSGDMKAKGSGNSTVSTNLVSSVSRNIKFGRNIQERTTAHATMNFTIPSAYLGHIIDIATHQNINEFIAIYYHAYTHSSIHVLDFLIALITCTHTRTRQFSTLQANHNKLWQQTKSDIDRKKTERKIN